MNASHPRLRRSSAAAALALAAASAASAASFNDTFDSAGDVASNYTGFELATLGSAAGVDSNTYSSGSSFALDAADGQVDLVTTIPSGFNNNLLARSVDTDNHYDINEGITLSFNASDYNAIFFPAGRDPGFFGTTGGPLNGDVTVSIQNFNFTNTILSVQVGGVDLPGGAQQIYPNLPSGITYTLNIDDDSYSVLADAAELIPDTLHNITFSSLEAVVPTFGAQKVFEGDGNTTLSVNSFAGEGTTFVVPEPATATLAAAGLGVLALRRRRGR